MGSGAATRPIWVEGAPKLSGAQTREDLRAVLRLLGQTQCLIERQNEREIPSSRHWGPAISGGEAAKPLQQSRHDQDHDCDDGQPQRKFRHYPPSTPPFLPTQPPMPQGSEQHQHTVSQNYAGSDLYDKLHGVSEWPMSTSALRCAAQRRARLLMGPILLRRAVGEAQRCHIAVRKLTVNADFFGVPRGLAYDGPRCCPRM